LGSPREAELLAADQMRVDRRQQASGWTVEDDEKPKKIARSLAVAPGGPSTQNGELHRSQRTLTCSMRTKAVKGSL
jgi:hypothetical protein